MFSYTLVYCSTRSDVEARRRRGFYGTGSGMARNSVFCCAVATGYGQMPPCAAPGYLRYDTRAEMYAASCHHPLADAVQRGMGLQSAGESARSGLPLRPIVAPSPDMRVMVPLALRVEGSGDDRGLRVRYMLDGKPLGLFADHMGEVVWNPSDAGFWVAPGGRNSAYAGRQFVHARKRFRFLLQAGSRALPFAVGDTLDLSALNGRIAVRAEIDASIVPKNSDVPCGSAGDCAANGSAIRPRLVEPVCIHSGRA